MSVQKSARQQDIERKRIRVIGLYEADYSVSEIARMVRSTRRIVRKWLERFATTGNVEDAHRSGRPPKQTRDMMKRVSRLMRGRRKASVRKVAQKLVSEGINVSATTVRRAAHALKLRPYHPRRKPLLTDAHKLDRRRFARTNRGRNWRDVLAADECTLYVSDTPNRQHDVVWARPGDEIPIVERGKAAVKVNVYAAIAYGGRSAVHVFDNNLTAELHINILNRTMLPAAQRIFGGRRYCYLQDRDPKHTARATVQWLDANVPEHLVSSWPASSPDLNPIENIWALLRDAVASTNPTTKRQLAAAVRRAWSAIDQQHIDHAMESMPQRLRAVLDAKGAHINF